jgi:hypothetical protein
MDLGQVTVQTEGKSVDLALAEGVEVGLGNLRATSLSFIATRSITAMER